MSAHKVMEKMRKRDNTFAGKPLPTFTLVTATAVVVGVVVGSGIFRLPPIVAAYAANPLQFILFWVAGGFISLTGALCYAELSTNHPDTGGEYYFLSQAISPAAGFLFNWGRMTVIQTGSIALVAFILGDYATLILDLGPHSPALYAAGVVVLLTILNITGTRHSQRTQLLLSSLIVLTMVILSAAGLLSSSATAATAAAAGSLTETVHAPVRPGGAGAAMIFVMLTFGGWNEAAYLSGELINVKKNMIRVLVIALTIITLLYILINLAYLRVLGFGGLQQSQTAAADLTGQIIGSTGSLVVAAIVVLSALSTINATIITGARTNYALGRDFRLFQRMGQWNRRHNAPVNALLVQGAVTLVLIAAGAWSAQAVEAMVDFTAPVFWFFLLLTTLTLFVFRREKKNKKLLFQVPLYPITPLVFLTACILMLYSGLAYTGIGALAGVALLLAGVPVFMLNRWFANRQSK